MFIYLSFFVLNNKFVSRMSSRVQAISDLILVNILAEYNSIQCLFSASVQKKTCFLEKSAAY